MSSHGALVNNNRERKFYGKCNKFLFTFLHFSSFLFLHFQFHLCKLLFEYSVATFIISLSAFGSATTSFHLLCNILLWILYEYMKFIKRDTFRNDKRYWRNFTNGNFPLCYFHHYVMYFPSVLFSLFIFYWMTHNVAALYEFIWIVADENSIFFLPFGSNEKWQIETKKKEIWGRKIDSREEIQLFFLLSEFLIAHKKKWWYQKGIRTSFYMWMSPLRFCL